MQTTTVINLVNQVEGQEKHWVSDQKNRQQKTQIYTNEPYKKEQFKSTYEQSSYSKQTKHMSRRDRKKLQFDGIIDDRGSDLSEQLDGSNGSQKMDEESIEADEVIQ